MDPQLQYYFQALSNSWTLPIMYAQGRKIKRTAPRLPPASHPTGTIGSGHDSYNILFIGESSMAGLGVADHKQSLAGHVSRIVSGQYGVSINYEVHAKVGYTAHKVAHKLLPGLQTTRYPDLIIIALGGNDTFRLHSPNQWIDGVSDVVDTLQERYPHPPILFAGLPYIQFFPAFTPLIRKVLGQRVLLLNRALDEWVQTRPGVYFDATRLSYDEWVQKAGGITNVDAYYSDGVHPSELTYRIWAEEIAGYATTRQLIRIPTQRYSMLMDGGE